VPCPEAWVGEGKGGENGVGGGQEQAIEEILKDEDVAGRVDEELLKDVDAVGAGVNPDKAKSGDDDPLHTGKGLVDKDDKSIKPSDAELEAMHIQFTIRMNDLHRHLNCKLPNMWYNSFLKRLLSDEQRHVVRNGWSLCKTKEPLTQESIEFNKSIYHRVGEENVSLTSLYTLRPRQ
ncbi:hypothetical protein GIB67_030088, partial [Kingdonia uniflora]